MRSLSTATREQPPLVTTKEKPSRTNKDPEQPKKLFLNSKIIEINKKPLQIVGNHERMGLKGVLSEEAHANLSLLRCKDKGYARW